MTATMNMINNNQAMMSFQGNLDKSGIRRVLSNIQLPDSNMTINMENVKNIDSSGIGFLMKLYKKISLQGCQLSLVNVPVKVKIILELTQFSRLVEINNDINSNSLFAA